MEGNKISEKDLLLIEEKVKTFFFLTRQYVEPSVSSNELGKKAIRLISESRYKASNKIHRKVWLYFVKQKIVLSAAMLFGVFIAGFGYYILKNMNISSNDCSYYKLWVEKIRGKVKLYRGIEGKKIANLRVKDEILWSDKIVTDNFSSLTIRTERGDLIFVGSNSNLYIKDILKMQNEKLSLFIMIIL